MILPWMHAAAETPPLVRFVLRALDSRGRNRRVDSFPSFRRRGLQICRGTLSRPAAGAVSVKARKLDCAGEAQAMPATAPEFLV